MQRSCGATVWFRRIPRSRPIDLDKKGRTYPPLVIAMNFDRLLPRHSSIIDRNDGPPSGRLLLLIAMNSSAPAPTSCALRSRTAFHCLFSCLILSLSCGLFAQTGTPPTTDRPREIDLRRNDPSGWVRSEEHTSELQ